MIRPAHVVDTNVLFDWVGHLCRTEPPRGASNKRNARFRRRMAAAARFCEDPLHEIVVPGLVLVELYGVFLQKGYALDDYHGWVRRRQAALNPLEVLLFDPESHVTYDDRPLDVELAVNLCKELVPNDVRRRQRGRAQRVGDPDFVAKALDGMDAGVVAAAWRVAEESPQRRVVLVTNDTGLRVAMGAWGRQERFCVAGRLFPRNLRAAGV